MMTSIFKMLVIVFKVTEMKIGSTHYRNENRFNALLFISGFFWAIVCAINWQSVSFEQNKICWRDFFRFFNIITNQVLKNLIKFVDRLTRYKTTQSSISLWGR